MGSRGVGGGSSRRPVGGSVQEIGMDEFVLLFKRWIVLRVTKPGVVRVMVVVRPFGLRA